MEIPLFFIRSVKLMPDCHSVCLIFPDAALPFIFELPFVFKDQPADKRGHSLDHDHEIITALIHVLYVFFAEVSTVKDKANSLIAIPFCLFQHELQL